MRGATAWALQTRSFNGGLPVAARLKQLTGVLNRLVRQPAHETIWEATRTAGTRFARVPTAKACAFCLMLASRGAVYTSRRAASTTSGERGTRPEGLRFHDHCNCLVVESYTDADLPQVVLDLQNEWAMVAGAENYPDLQDRAGVWEAHIRATRPLGSAIREVHSDGTTSVYPEASGIKIDAERLLNHVRFDPDRPLVGGHTAVAARELQALVLRGEQTLSAPKTFDSSGSEWFAATEMITDVVAAPDSVLKTRFGYEYVKAVDGPSGTVQLAVQIAPAKKPRGEGQAGTPRGSWQVTTVYPLSGTDVSVLNYDGSISDVPFGRRIS